jgi:hypothetical protein
LHRANERENLKEQLSTQQAEASLKSVLPRISRNRDEGRGWRFRGGNWGLWPRTTGKAPSLPESPNAYAEQSKTGPLLIAPVIPVISLRRFFLKPDSS